MTKRHPRITCTFLARLCKVLDADNPRKILVAFVYIYCLLECFSVWVSLCLVEMLGCFSSSAIRLVAREPTPLAVFFPSFFDKWFKFRFTLCSETPW